MQRLFAMHLGCLLLGAVLLVGCAPKAGQNNEAAPAVGAAGGGPAAMKQFREDHKYTFQLVRLLNNISRLDKDGKYPLSKTQAKSLLDILLPLRTQGQMTQDDAKDTIKTVQIVLTIDQRTTIGEMPQRQPGAGGGAPGGPGGAGFQGGPGGAPRAQFDPVAMKDFNPLNPKTVMPGRNNGKRMDDFFAALQAKAGK
jgi:hypothetical protein